MARRLAIWRAVEPSPRASVPAAAMARTSVRMAGSMARAAWEAISAAALPRSGVPHGGEETRKKLQPVRPSSPNPAW